MADETPAPRIKIRPDGPYLVAGVPALRRTRIERNEHERPVAWRSGAHLEHKDVYAMCRCGASANKPFCDGSHKTAGFDGTEHADRSPGATRRRSYGSGEVTLTDDKSLCWHAGYCVREHVHAWDLAGKADRDTADETLLEGMVHACPSGRLELLRGGEKVEPTGDPAIEVVDDGPLVVRGSVAIESADGAVYEAHARASLCRCGASKNKPFCDSSHVQAGFRESGSREG